MGSAGGGPAELFDDLQRSELPTLVAVTTTVGWSPGAMMTGLGLIEVSVNPGVGVGSLIVQLAPGVRPVSVTAAVVSPAGTVSVASVVNPSGCRSRQRKRVRYTVAESGQLFDQLQAARCVDDLDRRVVNGDDDGGLAAGTDHHRRGIDRLHFPTGGRGGLGHRAGGSEGDPADGCGVRRARASGPVIVTSVSNAVPSQSTCRVKLVSVATGD